MTQILEKHFETIRKIFLDYGIKSIAMDDIAGNLGISKKTLYKEYANKNELVRDVFLEDFSQFKAKANAISKDSSNAVEELYRLSDLFITSPNSLSISTLYDLKKYYHELFAEMVKLIDLLINDLITNGIKRGIAENNFNPDVEYDKIACFFAFIFESYFLHPLHNLSNVSMPFSGKDIMKYFYKGICTQQGIEILKSIQNS